MAELLVRATDTPVPDSPGRWYAGMVAAVMPDGHVWGTREGPPRFIIVKAPGWDAEVVSQFLEQDSAPGGRKRLYKVAPEFVATVLAEGGEVTVTGPPQKFIRQYLRENG